MMNFILASGNKHKAQEFEELMGDVLKVFPAPATIEVDETGKTFTENAYLKARGYFEKYKVPVMADDSGLVLEGSPELLGVESARFAPELPNYHDKCQKLLNIYQDRQIKNRQAYFVCVLCFYFSEQEIYFFEGRVHGEIGLAIKGDKGFGYDPIFIPQRKENDGLSLAELPEWKNQFSHRAKAVESAISFFKESMDKLIKKT
jgi:XTP/dITP diphosphohydrolase